MATKYLLQWPEIHVEIIHNVEHSELEAIGQAVAHSLDNYWDYERHLIECGWNSQWLFNTLRKPSHSSSVDV